MVQFSQSDINFTFLLYGSLQCTWIEDNRTFKIDIDVTLPQATKVIMTPHFCTAEMT